MVNGEKLEGRGNKETLNKLPTPASLSFVLAPLATGKA